MGLHVWGTLRKRAAISWIGPGQVHVGLGKICAEESELFLSDLMESGEAGITCSAQAGLQEVGVCTTVIKATLGIANSTQLTAVTLAPGDWEDFSCREKNTQLYVLPGNEDGLTEWSRTGDWR